MKFSLTYLTGDIDASSNVSYPFLYEVCGGSDIKTWLDEYLVDHSYINGYTLSEMDHVMYERVMSSGCWAPTRLPHLTRWTNHIETCRQGGFGSCRGIFPVRFLLHKQVRGACPVTMQHGLITYFTIH